MKHLSIVRHAKAERPEGYASDFERPLTNRGHKDAGRIGAVMAKLKPAVDLIISSPSARTAETADHLIEAMGYGGDVRWHDEVYLTDAGELLTLLKKLPNEAEHVLLVGHNPGLEALASGICGGQPEEVFVRMPTGTLAFVELDISQWSALRWGGGQLKLLISPKSLK